MFQIHDAGYNMGNEKSAIVLGLTMGDCLRACALHAGLFWGDSNLHGRGQLGSLQIQLTPLPEEHEGCC